MSILSAKSIDFARKILLHNPEHIVNCQQKQQSNNPKKHSHDQQIKPYLHVHDHRKERQIFEKSTKQKLESMKMFKEQGNQNFKSQKYQQAAYFYNKAIIFSDYTFPQTQKQQTQLDLLVQQSNCNLGVALVKLNQWDKSELNFMQAIKGPQTKLNKKGHYWLTKLFLRKGEVDKSQENLQKIKEIEGKQQQSISDETKQLQIQLNKLKKKNSQRSKETYTQMFSTSSS